MESCVKGPWTANSRLPDCAKKHSFRPSARYQHQRSIPATELDTSTSDRHQHQSSTPAPELDTSTRARHQHQSSTPAPELSHQHQRSTPAPELDTSTRARHQHQSSTPAPELDTSTRARHQHQSSTPAPELDTSIRYRHYDNGLERCSLRFRLHSKPSSGIWTPLDSAPCWWEELSATRSSARIGKEIRKDFDIEVYGTSYDRLADFLSRYGRVDLVGKSFGVVKLLGLDLSSVDFSIPRRESKTGPHHRGFQTTFDESITPREAASRRDFTINAIAFDPIRGEVLDFFGGQEDLKNRILRATSPAFSEDPLRVLRGMQFACRFGLTVDPGDRGDVPFHLGRIQLLARERVAGEFMKWTGSSRPGRILQYLSVTGWIVHFPEIGALAGVPQDPSWHPEGDVGIHTMLVVDAAARIAARENLEGDPRAVLLFSALCHDFAKPATTQLRDRDGRQRWTSWGHEAAGGPMARAFLERIGIKSASVDQVIPIVEHHLTHSSIGRDPTPRAVRRLAMHLAPASILQLLHLTESDHSGRPPLPPGLPEGALRIHRMAVAQAVEHEPQAPMILGRHVLPYFDNRPGKHIGEVTAAAIEAQADGEFSTQEEALQWLERYLNVEKR